ncbi:hypothetical protein C8D87_1011080 [Lentzea atacamensis]|uniref:N-acetyltransferase domain-containing protein n=1 Tax=Lentzea atacamensis TaxID=531938 RepID=A0ABX9EKT8_9PSEU|nr:hypothetical protein [Lentzea atacamensis]RAS70779.1 hypothetical protein C8D87_1011080 [Lentzea atacamensis]
MKLVAASSLTEAELARARQIYFDGFAPHLRASFDDDLLADTALVLVDAKPLGLAVLRVLADTGWVYLRYFTVGEKGRGLGARLWTHLRDEMTVAGYTRIIYDVEDPAQPGIGPAAELVRHRRIAFYQRIGAVLAVYEHRYGMAATDPVVAETLRLSGLSYSRADPTFQ